MRQYVSLFLIVLTCAATGAAQQSGAPSAGQEPAAVFGTEVNFVEVHAIVTDEKEAFVKDLTAEDFEILEDGHPQKTAVFSLVDLPVERPLMAAGRTEPVEPDVRQATRSFDGRIYVLVLDELHTDFSRSALVKDAATKFIRQYLGADDLAAVVYTSDRVEAGQELTNRPSLVLASIDRFMGKKLPSASAEKLAIHIRDTATGEALADDGQPVRSVAGLQAARDIKDPYAAQRAQNARRTLEAVGNVARWMSDVQGRRKALLLFSEGIDYDIYEPFSNVATGLVQDAQDAVGRAQRANVNVYAVDPRGLNQFGTLMAVHAGSDYPQLEYGTFRGHFRELLLAQESLITLAEQTGGLAIVNQNDVVGGLGRVVLDNSRYYILGYHSDSGRWSRKFLPIEVRVKRPGLKVRARRGFMPPDPRAVEKARAMEVAAGTSPALAAALKKPLPIGQLPMRVFAAPFKGAGKNSSVLLALEIDGQALKFQPRDGRFSEKLEISIVATDQKAKVQGGDRQQFDLNLMPETYERVSRSGVRLMSRLELPPGRYQFRVGAHESTGGLMATVPYELEVPDFSQMPLGMSGILITSSEANAVVTPNPDPELKDVLATPPVARRRFAPTETLTSFVEVYDGSSPTAHTLEVVTSVQSAQDGRPAFVTRDDRAEGPSATPRTHGFTASIPLKDLPPGMYVLRVEAKASGAGQSAVREVPFEVSSK